MQKILTYACFWALILCWSACSSNKDVKPSDSFTKIYDNGEFGGSFFPVDVKQTTDGGYLILAEARLTSSNFYGVYLLRTNERGDVIWSRQAPANFVNPVPGLFAVNDQFFFFCMDATSLATYAMQVVEGGDPVIVQTFGTLIYPLHASRLPDGGYILLSYDRVLQSTRMTRFNANFGIVWQNQYAVLENPEALLVAHLTRTGQRLPFLTGFIGDGSPNTFFFNGFQNFTFALKFVNVANGDGAGLGVINGFRYSGAISAAVPIANNRFAFTRFSFGSNFILPQQTISTLAIASASDFGGQPLSELNNNAKVAALRITSGSRDVVIFASDTKANQIVLYAYNAQTGALIRTKYLGSGNPYEIANLATTQDGGLVIIGTNYLAGRFPRIALFKLSSAEFNNFVK
ncbi:MAG TPA: hypothetical protein DCM08_09735 [Microscillaceae bacterium]|jgi:outer membrane protein assembly factor BamB|nr:hypothetical protein [Microscillaceae bacterium]